MGTSQQFFPQKLLDLFRCHFYLTETTRDGVGLIVL